MQPRTRINKVTIYRNTQTQIPKTKLIPLTYDLGYSAFCKSKTIGESAHIIKQKQNTTVDVNQKAKKNKLTSKKQKTPSQMQHKTTPSRKNPQHQHLNQKKTRSDISIHQTIKSIS
jgi:hypothetical protein